MHICLIFFLVQHIYRLQVYITKYEIGIWGSAIVPGHDNCLQRKENSVSYVVSAIPIAIQPLCLLTQTKEIMAYLILRCFVESKNP